MSDLSRLMPAVDDGPEPLPWGTYAAAAMAELREKLDAGAGEKEMQKFLELHPPLVPGAFPGFSGHGAWPSVLITQPKLQGYGHRVPDFMWISRDSGAVRPVLIEIEDPKKPWLSDEKNPRQSAELTQALNQFRQWKDWLETNQDVFLRSFGVPPEWRDRGLRPQYILIYGRDDERPEEAAKLRRYLRDQTPGTEFLTFDRLQPIQKQQHYLCAKCDGLGNYTVIAVPATAKFTPDDPDTWRRVSGRLAAVEANQDISDARKAFLAEYLPQCDAWATGYEKTQQEVFAQLRREKEARA